MSGRMSTSNHKDNYRIAVSTIGDKIDSVKLQSTIDYRACNNRDRSIVSTI